MTHGIMRWSILILIFTLITERSLWHSGLAWAADDKTIHPEEDDEKGTPFTEYGEFKQQSDDEESDLRFLQYGRLFAVSLGLGFQFADGNRGALWQGGFPMFDLRLHYWFDFNLAIDLGVFTAQQYYYTTTQSLGHVDVNIVHVGVDVKYYFDTKNLSAAITFANPYITAGAGYFSKTENSISAGTQDPDSSLGVSVGAGLEFAVSPQKTYFVVEGKAHIVTFKDTYTTIYDSSTSTPNLPDLTGFFYTVSGSFLYAW